MKDIKLTYNWDDCGGYDYFTPAVIIYGFDRKRIMIMDANDFGWNDTSLGSHIDGHRNRVQRDMLALARRITESANVLPEVVEAVNKVLAEAENCLEVEAPSGLFELKQALARASTVEVSK